MCCASSQKCITASSEGDRITYRVTVSNYGPSSANGIMAAVSLPGQVTYVSQTATQGSSDAVNWNVGSLVNGASAVLDIQVTINAGTASTTIPYTVSITAVDEVDSNLSDNTFTTNVTVLP